MPQQRAHCDDGKYPYDAVGALLRHGPVPFITRMTNARRVRAGSAEVHGRGQGFEVEAWGTWTPSLNNAMDWMYQKQAEKDGAPVRGRHMVLDRKQATDHRLAFGINPLAVNVVDETVTQAMMPLNTTSPAIT